MLVGQFIVGPPNYVWAVYTLTNYLFGYFFNFYLFCYVKYLFWLG